MDYLRAPDAELDRLRDALRSSELLRAAFLEVAIDCIVAIDHHGIVTEFNPAAERTFGYPRSEAVGRVMADLIVPPGLRGEHLKGLARYLATGEAHVLGKRVEISAMRADGSEFPVELSITRIPLSGPPAFIAFIRDITARKQAEQALRDSEEQLRQAHKMEAIGQLAGGIAHDFNNLLTGIMGYSHLLMKSLQGRDADLDRVRVILQASERAASLTRQLLAFSRKQVLEPRLLDLSTVVRGLEPILLTSLGGSVELRLHLSHELWRVKADPGQIEQVLMNLALNARDAMPRGGALTIETSNVELDPAHARHHAGSVAGPHVRLAVTDTGVGMSPEVQARVFEPFFTTKRAGQGTGLGLSMVYGIVQQSGGIIEIHSEEGRGTTFSIRLPQCDLEDPIARIERPREDRRGGSETLLLVEDEEIVRRFATDVLTAAGYTLLVASDGGEALAMESSHPSHIHLMITDVVMPGLGGPELATKMATRRPDMRVLYVSGFTDEAIIQGEGVLEASTSFLQKPFRPRELVAKVRQVLDTPARRA